MHNLLTKLLQKRKIENVKDLTTEEKEQFDSWDRVLSKDEMTLEDVKSFCKNQVDVIEAKWKDYKIKNEKKAEFIPYHTVYKSILGAIDSPKSAREALEKNLNQLLNT